MGVYAETKFAIRCKDKKTASKVFKVLESAGEDEMGNTFGEDLNMAGNDVYGFESSGRYQNLEYRCNKIWELVKDIKGVIVADFPFMLEADGMYFENSLKPAGKINKKK